MPIHDLGYRGWEGASTPRWLRPCAIGRIGVRLSWKQPWLRRLCFVAWMPSLYFGLFFFAYEKLAEFANAGGPGVAREAGLRDFEGGRGPGRRRAPRSGLAPGWVRGFVPNGLPLPRDLAIAILEDPARARAPTWRWAFYHFFRASQAVLYALVVGFVASPLIARDVQSRASILYFSRPLTPLEYLLGKAGVVWIFGLSITAVPALLLYAVAVFLSPSFSILRDTWDIPLRILAASGILLVPTTSLALALSSLVAESRYATFGWFAVWAFGALLYRSREDALLLVQGPAPEGAAASGPGWICLSLFDALGKAQEWAFGVIGAEVEVRIVLAFLAALAVASAALLIRRVSHPLRA